jgi:hypothetical protein
MQTVSVSDFRSNISEYLNQIKYNNTGNLNKNGNKIEAQVNKPQTQPISKPSQDFATKWSGAFNIKNPIPADKIRDLIDYSDL